MSLTIMNDNKFLVGNQESFVLIHPQFLTDCYKTYWIGHCPLSYIYKNKSYDY